MRPQPGEGPVWPAPNERDTRRSGALIELDGRSLGLLGEHLNTVLALARRSGREQLLSVTLPLPEAADPCAVAFACRAGEERLFCLEQPARGGAAIAALGCLESMQASGPGRFAQLARRWRELSRSASSLMIGDERSGARRPAPGPVALGGFAFSDSGCSGPVWGDFANSELYVPELALERRAGEGLRLTMSTYVAPDDTAAEHLERLRRQCERLVHSALPLLDPAPTGEHRVASAMPPEHYEGAVQRAKELIAAGRLEKLVLAREVQVQAPRPYQPAALFGALRDAFDSCFSYCVARGQSTLIGASPELLVRREGQRVSTLALAGSARRSADPAVDSHLGEQLLRSASYREEHAIVVRRIERTLRSRALWVTAAPEPQLVRVANIQHLATPIRAQLGEPADAVELAGLLHPTPAIGGEPSDRALSLIPELEGLDRGWYSGPIGWVDAAGDGEYCVALRCALLRGASGHCFAGNGIVRDSDPAAELAETEVKLQAMLPLLSG